MQPASVEIYQPYLTVDGKNENQNFQRNVHDVLYAEPLNDVFNAAYSFIRMPLACMWWRHRTLAPSKKAPIHFV